jgi:hypothetical protein
MHSLRQCGSGLKTDIQQQSYQQRDHGRPRAAACVAATPRLPSAAASAERAYKHQTPPCHATPVTQLIKKHGTSSALRPDGWTDLDQKKAQL